MRSTDGAAEYISGVILYDETIRQSSADGTPFPKLLESQGIIPGIKVDTGAKPLAGADAGDTGLAQVVEGVEQGLRPEVERVVVRERHAVDAEPVQDLGRGRRRPEEEPLAWVVPRPSVLRDAALEVEYEEIRRPR